MNGKAARNLRKKARYDKGACDGESFERKVYVALKKLHKSLPWNKRNRYE